MTQPATGVDFFGGDFQGILDEVEQKSGPLPPVLKKKFLP